MFQFDRTYYINLDHRPDRANEFLDAFPESLGNPVRFPATDGNKAKRPPWWIHTAGALGCFLSHQALIEQCLADGVESVLVLEDDAMPEGEFERRYNEFMDSLPDDWRWLYLGGYHKFADKHPPQQVNQFVWRPHAVRGTFAYALRGRDIMLLLRDELADPEIDSKYGVNHIDWIFAGLHSHLFGVYCPDDWLFGHAAGLSDITNQYLPQPYFPGAREVAEYQERDK